MYKLQKNNVELNKLLQNLKPEFWSNLKLELQTNLKTELLMNQCMSIALEISVKQFAQIHLWSKFK